MFDKWTKKRAGVPEVAETLDQDLDPELRNKGKSQNPPGKAVREADCQYNDWVGSGPG